jgi:type I restriction enzyme M protein
LLKEKWISPLTKALEGLPVEIISEFETKVKTLIEKYLVTARDIETQIKDTSESLLLLIDDLEGGEYDLKGITGLKSLLKGD